MSLLYIHNSAVFKGGSWRHQNPCGIVLKVFANPCRNNTGFGIVHIDITHNAENDLTRLWVDDPAAAAVVTVALEQLEADPRALDKLTTHGNNNVGASRLNIKQWEAMNKKRANVWRFRVLDTPATNYRVVYGYHWQTKQLCIFAIVHKEQFDYDDTDNDLSRRILNDWRAL